jgi:hypothetical protein
MVEVDSADSMPAVVAAMGVAVATDNSTLKLTDFPLNNGYIWAR